MKTPTHAKYIENLVFEPSKRQCKYTGSKVDTASKVKGVTYLEAWTKFMRTTNTLCGASSGKGLLRLYFGKLLFTKALSIFILLFGSLLRPVDPFFVFCIGCQFIGKVFGNGRPAQPLLSAILIAFVGFCIMSVPSPSFHVALSTS